MNELLERVLEAHGGLARWQEIAGIEARVRFGGLAFLARGRRGTGRWRRIEVDAREPRVTLHDYPSRGKRGHFAGDRVWIEREADLGAGRTPHGRSDARRRILHWRRQLWWDALDLLYFSGYAIWNYLTLPFLLAAPGVSSREVAGRTVGGTSLRTLEVHFPREIPTHCEEQRFHFDERLLLKRHDYDPETFASWARAAHWCDGHEWVEGIPFATRRRVVPRDRDGLARSGPTLVWIELADLRLR